jgi:hypothetical protein
LNVAHAGEKEVVFLISKGGERFGKCILGPALWVRLCWIFEKSREGCSQIWHQAGQMVVQRKGRGLGKRSNSCDC